MHGYAYANIPLQSLQRPVTYVTQTELQIQITSPPVIYRCQNNMFPKLTDIFQITLYTSCLHTYRDTPAVVHQTQVSLLYPIILSVLIYSVRDTK